MNDTTESQLHTLGKLIDGDLQLVLYDTSDLNTGWFTSYKFKMMLGSQNTEVGSIELRNGAHHLVVNAGHLAYDVHPEHRGHHYAARACKLLLPLARTQGLNFVWITCRPENMASRRTCEIIGAELVDVIDLSEDTDMYRRGYRQLCRYRLEL
jgi:tagatose 1,6-diphosphate aldolase